MIAYSFAALWILWPIAAFAGGAALSPILFLASGAALIGMRAERPKAYVIPAMLFVAWACLTSIWSPGSTGLVEGSLSNGDFSVESAPLRFCLTIGAALVIVGAAMQATRSVASRTLKIAAVAIGLQAVAVILIATFYDRALALFAPVSDQASSPQNVIRNANLFALAAPIGAASLWAMLRGHVAVVATVLASFAAIWAFAMLDAQSAIVAIVLSAACIGCLWVFPSNGFRILLLGAAGSLLMVPLVFSRLGRWLGAASEHLPDSFRWRLHIWEATGDRIGSRPLTGHGMEASKTWTEPFSTRPDWLESLPKAWADSSIIPGHPHNFALQIWAETGMVGASLAAAAIAGLALRLPEPASLSIDARIAAGGLIGSSLAIAMFAYSIWNEAYWAGLAIVGASVVLISRREAT